MDASDWNLKPFHAELLHIFREFEKVCLKHNLRYYSSGGTTLGAVRHKGFIPWDDDFDIEMPHEDFVKLLQYQDELPEHLKIRRGGGSDPVYFAKIVDCRDGLAKELSAQTKLNIDFQPFVDIFMIEGLPENVRDIRRWWRQRILWRLCQMYRFPETITARGIRRLFQRVLTAFLGFFVTWFYPRTRTNEEMMSLLDKIAAQHSFDESFTVVEPAFFRGRTRRIVPRYYYEPAREMQFEDGMIRVPNHAEDFCRNNYGDFMKLPPEEWRIPEHASKRAYEHV